MKKIAFMLSLMFAAILLPAGTTVVFDQADNASGWGLSLGSEFPGATGKIYLDATGKVTAEGNFSKGGAFIAPLYRKALPTDTKKLEIAVTALTPCDTALRIEDAEKRFFQTDRVLLKQGESTVLTAQLDSADWKIKWGGKDLKEVAPKFPLRAIYINTIRPHGANAPEIVKLRIDEIRIESDSYEPPPNAILFDRAETLSDWGFSNGAEFPGATGKVFLEETGKVAVEGNFSKGGVFVASLYRKPLPPGTQRIEFVVTALTECDAAIRIHAADNAFFQTDRRFLKPGASTVLVAQLDSSTWSGKWGGANHKDAIPKQPFKEIYINAIRPHGANPPEIVKFRIDEVRIVWPDTALDANVVIDNEFNLLLPDTVQEPKFKLQNNGRKELELEGTIAIQSYDEAVTSHSFQQNIAAGEAFDWTIPLPQDAQGLWVISWNLTDKKSQKTFTGTDRIGRMIPAGETQERFDSYLFGVCSHPYNHAPAIREREARAAALCGVKIMRTDARWERQIQRNGPDEWNFSIVDHVVDTYAKHGMEVQMILSYGPRWAVAKDWKPFSKEPRFAQWGGRPEYEYWKAFVEKTFDRYRGKIRYYEVWNEPDLDYFANFSPEEYLKMQEIAFKALRATDPAAKLMNGGVAWIGPDRGGPRKGIIDKIINSGTIDIFAFHGHGGFVDYVPQIPYFKRYMKNPMPWYSNETAISSTAAGEYIQAKTLFQKFLHAWAEGSIGYNWYDLRNDGFDPKNGEHNFGMITNDFKPKAVYLTYNMLATHLRGATYEGTLAINKPLSAYQFRATNGDLFISIWNNEPAGADQPFFLGGITGKAEVIDLMGNRSELTVVNGEILLAAGFEPMLLRLAAQKDAPRTNADSVLALRDFSIDPGMATEIVIPAKNLSTRTQEFRLTGTLPEGVEGKINSSNRLRAGEAKELKLKLKAANAFRSYASAPKVMVFTLTIGDFPPVKLRCPLLTAVNIPSGNLPKEPSFQLNRVDQVHSFIVNEPATAHLHWNGANDLSAEIRLAYRNGKLMLEALVTDDVHYQKESGSDVWQGDNIQFALRLPGQSDFWEIGLTHLENRSPEVYIWRTPQGFDAEKAAAKINLATDRNEAKKLTTYKAEIPFDAIGLTEKAGSEGFRFNLIVNDNDGEIRESFIMVAPGIGASKDTAKYPLVRFR